MSTDGIHLVFLFSFDDSARQGNEVWPKLRGFLVRGEERGVEDTMYLPGWWETKAIGVWGDNLRDLEGAFSSRGQFSRRKVNLQVSRVEPYLRSYFPRGKLCSNPFFDSLSGFSMSGRGFFPSSIKEFESFVKGREECLPNRGVGSGFKTHHEREWSLVGDRVGGRVMRKLGHR